MLEGHSLGAWGTPTHTAYMACALPCPCAPLDTPGCLRAFSLSTGHLVTTVPAHVGFDCDGVALSDDARLVGRGAGRVGGAGRRVGWAAWGARREARAAGFGAGFGCAPGFNFACGSSIYTH